MSWAMDMQATIVHVDAALSALNNIHTTVDKLETELNLKKSSLYNLETAIQLAGTRRHDLSRPSKKPLGLSENLMSFPGLLDDELEDLKHVRENGKILVQICDSVNVTFQKLGLDIES